MEKKIESILLGDYHNFGIYLESVSQWNTNKGDGTNGFVFFLVEGQFVPRKLYFVNFDKILASTWNQFKNISVNTELFCLEKDDLYSRLFNLVYPINVYPSAIRDTRYSINLEFIFSFNLINLAVSDGYNTKILANYSDFFSDNTRPGLNYNCKKADIVQAVIPNIELANIIEQAECFNKHLLESREVKC